MVRVRPYPRGSLVAFYARRGYTTIGEANPFFDDDLHGFPQMESLRFAHLHKRL